MPFFIQPAFIRHISTIQKSAVVRQRKMIHQNDAFQFLFCKSGNDFSRRLTISGNPFPGCLILYRMRQLNHCKSIVIAHFKSQSDQLLHSVFKVCNAIFFFAVIFFTNQISHGSWINRLDIVFKFRGKLRQIHPCLTDIDYVPLINRVFPIVDNAAFRHSSVRPAHPFLKMTHIASLASKLPVSALRLHAACKQPRIVFICLPLCPEHIGD